VKRRFIEYGVVTVGPIASAALVRAFVIKPSRVPAESAASTPRPGDRTPVDRIAQRRGEPQRGDVGVVRSPEDRDIMFTGPIVGIADDALPVREWRLWANGRCQTVNRVTPR
jgi:signal peptidase I